MRRLGLLLLAAGLRANAPVSELTIVPRAAALGGACVACRGTVEGLWGNPAGLLGRDWELSAGSLGWIQDVSVQGIQGRASNGHAAAALGTQGYQIEDGQRDDLGRPVGSFHFGDQTQGMGLAFGGAGLAVGAALRFHSLHWDMPGAYNNSYTETLIDTGALGRLPWRGWDWGLGWRGLSASGTTGSNCYICLPQYEFTQPSFQGGMAWHSRTEVLTVLAQGDWDSADGRSGLHLGVEQTGRFPSDGGWAVRAGWRSDLAGLGGYAGFSAGLGLRWSLFNLDYAFSTLGDFGLSHRAALSLRGRP